MSDYQRSCHGPWLKVLMGRVVKMIPICKCDSILMFFRWSQFCKYSILERLYFVCFVEVWKVRNLIEPSFGTLERPDNLNIAGEDHKVGDEGADDEHHLNIEHVMAWHDVIHIWCVHIGYLKSKLQIWPEILYPQKIKDWGAASQFEAKLST